MHSTWAGHGISIRDPNIVVNGDFSDGLTGWSTPLGNWTVSAGQATQTSAADYYPLGQSGLLAGFQYRLTFDLVSITSGTLSFRTNNGATIHGQWTVSGSQTLVFTADTTDFSFGRSASPLTCTVDNISIILL